ncbi:Gliding motility lipoprotein precursor GldH [Tenacibaculum maritimum]|uniref:gliding motility lipoprotein GldH n=1 Tax=Tenacibaculum maritimum TaxID=107401 RepID=UPI0012E5DDF6|nr:gliding motility lipoprotein GldH [Tenacibaculum maritimum]CAA0179948.1 Gliding motility lipoprotein precursor GldH [Tenacibaculum maritimum]
MDKSYVILLILFISSFSSCDSKRIYDSYSPIPEEKWKKNSPISFSFSASDTLTPKNLFINIRNNNEYSFSNLFLITKMTFPDGQKITDTLEYEMTGPRGRFLGQGFSDIKENKLLYKENIVFPKLGNYTIDIYQSMRKNGAINGVIELEGITDVGFRIEKN